MNAIIEIVKIFDTISVCGSFGMKKGHPKVASWSILRGGPYRRFRLQP